MGDYIQLIGSAVLASFVLFFLFYFNMDVNNSAQNYYNDKYNLENAETIGGIIDYDFYKIGYNVSGSQIMQADSNSITFLSDISNSGKIDTVSYYLGPADSLSLQPLYRKLDQKVNTIGMVKKFNVQYYDSLLNKMSYSQLTGSYYLAKVRVIKALVETKLVNSTNKSKSLVEWQKEIRPRNLR